MRKEDTTQKLINYIVRKIAQEEWPPGMRVLEVDLAEESNTSRTTVRSAVSFLVGQGLLSNHIGKISVPKLTDKELKDLFEFRVAIESAAVKLACQRATERQLKEINKLIKRMEVSIETGELHDFPKADQDFHLKIALAAKNEKFFSLLPILRLQTVRHRNMALLSKEQCLARLEEHRLIAKKLMARDQSGAANAMRNHLTKTCKTYEKLNGEKRPSINE